MLNVSVSPVFLPCILSVVGTSPLTACSSSCLTVRSCAGYLYDGNRCYLNVGAVGASVCGVLRPYSVYGAWTGRSGRVCPYDDSVSFSSTCLRPVLPVSDVSHGRWADVMVDGMNLNYSLLSSGIEEDGIQMVDGRVVLANRTDQLVLRGSAGAVRSVVYCSGFCDVNVSGDVVVVILSGATSGSVVASRLVVAGDVSSSEMRVDLYVDVSSDVSVSHVVGTISGVADRFVIQSGVSGHVDASGLVSSYVLNVTELAGTFTPEFESVYFGGLSDLGPDPVVIQFLREVGVSVAALSWTCAILLGFDRFLT